MYIAIDLKSFYASVECIERGLDPMNTNLVVADKSRTDKTICLAVSPSLKACGIPGRPRLFEVNRRIKEVNAERIMKAPGKKFTGASVHAIELEYMPNLKADFVAAVPRMALYLEYSGRIYDIYLKYVAPEDIHVYSIDEVFMDVTHYLNTYQMTARELAAKIVRDVLETTGITSTAGIGTNLYLCKVAMDIVAKHIPPDKHGVRIAKLDETSYRRLLWTHRPLTDFWRIGRGYARKLEAQGLYTMGDIARCSLGGDDDYYNEDLLYKMFGVNAELLIDHAWGWEPCRMEDIKAYKPENSSMGSGQVLQSAYDFRKAGLVVKEMAEQAALELVDKGLVTDQMVLTIGYDRSSLENPEIRKAYRGEVTVDYYGRRVPKHAHGTQNLGRWTASARIITEAVMELYSRITDEKLLIRRISVTANHVTAEADARKEETYEQLNLFTDYGKLNKQQEEEKEALGKERKLQQTMLEIKKRYGKNAVLKGMNLEEGATAKERNNQIGGHKA
ncbi:MAG: DNA methylase [Dorea sp.]|jgi:DNA polymerase V|nr:DNA methylase [Dorea sp.]MCI9270240.1 DNA methylase [Dorea sp.]